jgi:LacI family transcriptional regulator
MRPARRRALAGGEEIRICLLFSNPSTSFLSELLMGSLEQASHHNVMLAVEKLTEPLSVEAVLAHLKHARINGIILPPPLCDSPRCWRPCATPDPRGYTGGQPSTRSFFLDQHG